MSAGGHGNPAAYLGPENCPAPIRGLAKLNRFLAVLEGVGIGLVLGTLIILASYQFLGRNLHNHVPSFPAPPLWINGVIQYSVFFIGFLGAAFATSVIKHLRVDAVTRLVPPRPRLMMRVLATLVAMWVCYMLIKAGWAHRLQIVLNESGDASQADEVITSARGALALPIGFALIMFHLGVQVILDVTWILMGGEPPPEWMAEAHGGEISTDEEESASASTGAGGAQS